MTPPRPTSVRYFVLAALAVAAVFMYVDRVCLAQVKGDVQKDLGLSPQETDWILSGFFWAYALAQVPAGAFAAKFGLRRTFACCLFLWSAFTVASGLASGFAGLLACRLMVGLTEAAAYPTAATLVKAWFPLHRRGFANSIVSLGGRLGGAAGQLLTPIFVLAFVGWRPTLMLFGWLGIAWAVVFWLVVRDSAAKHPRANEAEAGLAGSPPKGSTAFPLRQILSHRGLWLAGLAQFGTNVGWAFLITQFPSYLETAHGVSGERKGLLASIPAFVGCVGMFAGGFLTDAVTVRLGLRWGRSLPLGAALFGCSAAYLAASQAATAWGVVIALSAMTVCVDLGIPALWAFAQDVGGRHTAAALGWANMCGNLGAAACPLVLGSVQREFGWSAVFVTCAASFAVAGTAGLMLDARIPVQAEEEDDRDAAASM